MIYDIKPRFNVVGQLRTGEVVAAANGKTRPQATDHFVFHGLNDEHEAAFAATYGEQPRRVRVYLAAATEEAVFPHFYRCWTASSLLCRGDGRTVLHRADDPAAQGGVCAGPRRCDFSMGHGRDGKPGCKAQGQLYVMLPDMPGCGIYEVIVGRRSIGAVLGALRLGLAMRGPRGLFGLEYWLGLAEGQAKQPDGKPLTVWTITMDLINAECGMRNAELKMGEEGNPTNEESSTLKREQHTEETERVRTEWYKKITELRRALKMTADDVRGLIVQRFDKQPEELTADELGQVPALLQKGKSHG